MLLTYRSNYGQTYSRVGNCRWKADGDIVKTSSNRKSRWRLNVSATTDTDPQCNQETTQHAADCSLWQQCIIPLYSRHVLVKVVSQLFANIVALNVKC